MACADNFHINHNVEMTSNDFMLDFKDSPCDFELELLKKKNRTKKEQEYLKDVWSVKEIDYTFKSVSKPSTTIENLLLAKKAEDNSMLKCFTDELENLYKTCEANIKELKKNLQSEINTIHINVEKEKDNFSDKGCVTDQDYEELNNKVELLANKEVTIIEGCFNHIDSIEIKRQNNAVEIFKRYNVILQKVFRLETNSVQKFMENKITEYNEMALTNRKELEKFKSQLLLNADSFRQTFFTWLMEIKKNKIGICRIDALSDFESEISCLKNAGSMYLQTLEGKAAFCRLKSRKSLITEIIEHWNLDIPFSVNRIEKQYCELDSAIFSIETNIIKFIKSYKSYVLTFFCTLYNKLMKLKEITEMSEELDEKNMKISENMYDFEKQQFDIFICELEKKMYLIIKNLKDKAETIFKTFKDFGSPWDVQAISFSKLQDSILKQLEKRAEKSASTHFDFQQNIHAEIIILREEGGIEKLDKKLTQVFAIIDRKEKKHKNDYEEDCKIIRKCKDTVKIEVVALKNKYDKFLEINKPLETESVTSLHESAENDCLCDFELEDVILQELQLIEKQTASLDNWKLNFLTSMILYQPSFEKDIFDTVESWVNELLVETKHRLDENIKSCDKSRKSISKEIYDVRLKELLDHQNNLERHIKMITGLMQESGKCIDIFLNFTDMIDNFQCETFHMIEEYGSKITNSSQIICLQNRIKNLKENYKNKINSRIKCTSERMMKKFALMADHNKSFQSEIKLFQDGGNYTIEELNITEKEISQLLKNIQKDECENHEKITKATDCMNFQLENIDNCLFQCLNITLKKLQVQEDIINVMKKCEYFVDINIKRLKKSSNQIIDEIKNFIKNVHNKVPLNEIILNKLMKKLQDNFNFIQYPIPNIDIPQNISCTTALKNNRDKEKNIKESKLKVKSTNEQITNVNDKQCNHSSNNFAFVIKFIQEALAIINDRATNYYTTLRNKSEHFLICNRNKSCEICIDKSLHQLRVIYTIICNCWTYEINKILKFFKTEKMPSIDLYSLNKDLSDEESETILSVENNFNHYLSVKVDQNFTKFQSILQEFLSLLQSKDPISTSDE